MRGRRWPTLNQMREAYAASGLELAKRHPQCLGKIRHGTAADADLHVATLVAKVDEHERRARRIGWYGCRWCGGYHVGHRPLAPGRRRRGRKGTAVWHDSRARKN